MSSHPMSDHIKDNQMQPKRTFVSHAEAVRALIEKSNYTKGNQMQPKGTFASHAEAVRTLIEKSEIISFDIFDTLLIRPFINPTDVFLLIERRTGIKGFHDARILAERSAREKNYSISGTYEINLDQIYKEIRIPNFDKSSKDTIKQLEIKTEQEILKRSPYIGEIYDLAVSLGKKIIAVSDMYLPKDFLFDVLAENNLPVEQVFVSCEYGVSKHEGYLYEIVSKELDIEKSKILHFGDNFRSDYSAALDAGIVGYFVPSVTEQLYRDFRYNHSAISQLVQLSRADHSVDRNLFSSLIVAFIALFKVKNPEIHISHLFGAMYGGPLVTGFTTWMNVVMKIDKITHLRLATRDGYITQEIWNRLGFEDKTSILQSSRRLTLVPALYSNFDNEIITLLSTSTSCTLRENIEKLGIYKEEADELLKALAHCAPIDTALDTPEKISTALAALKECKPLWQKIAKREKEAYERYLKEEKFDPTKDVLVDCGWALSSQRRTELILNRQFKGYYVGTLEHAYMHENIRSFLFHHGQEKEWVRIAERGVELLELPFASTETQVSYFVETEEGVQSVRTHCQKQYDLLIENFVCGMQEEIRLFADFFKPYSTIITIKELRDSIFILFDSLVNNPSQYEYHELSSLPHSRELGASGFTTIGKYWITNHRNNMSQPPIINWKDYIRIGWASLRQEGILLTWTRVKRVIYRRFKL